MGRGAHVFLAAGHHDFAVAIGDGLSGEHHGLQAGAAHRVEGQARHFLGQAGLHQGLARGVLTRAGGEHLAHDHFTDVRRIEPGAGNRLADHGGAQIGRGDLGQRAAELANSGSGRRDDDDIFHGGLLLLNESQALAFT